MKSNTTTTACALLGAALFTGCQAYQKKQPAPQSHVIFSTSENFAKSKTPPAHAAKSNTVPAHAVYTIRQENGTYDTFTYDHGKRTSVKNTPTPP